MLTDERGEILCRRREHMSIHEIWSEILGNISGTHLNIFLEGGTLYIHQNDGGLDENDKEAVIAKKKTSKKKGTASLNGIGIRAAIDAMCERMTDVSGTSGKPVELISVGHDLKEKMCFYFLKNPSWKISEWTLLEGRPLELFRRSNLLMGLVPDTPGSMWCIPLNQRFKHVMDLQQTPVKYITRVFFNRKIFDESIRIMYLDKAIKRRPRLCNGVADSFQFTYREKGNRRTYRCLSPSETTLQRYQFLNSQMNFMETSFEASSQNFTVTHDSEEMIVRMKNYTRLEYERITRYYKVNHQLKGIWVYINGMCILSTPLLEASGYKDYFPQEFCPIIEIELETHTKMFNLSGRKSNSHPTDEGKTLCKFLWALFHKIYDIPKPAPKPKVTKEDLKAQLITKTQEVDMLRNQLSVGSRTNQPSRNIPDATKTTIWENLFQVTLRQKCPCCNLHEISPYAVEWGHIVSVKDGGTTAIDNIIPICVRCNRNMGTQNLLTWTQQHYPESMARIRRHLASVST